MTTLAELETPALLLDRRRLLRNSERMEARARALGVALRPHLKTCKSADVARLLPAAGAHGITVSTTREAEYFAAQGWRDQLYAVAVAPHRLPRLAALARNGVRVRLAADSAEAVRWIGDAAQREGVVFEVMLEVDSGEHRSGLLPRDPDLVALARRLADRRDTRFAGVYTHAGHSYGAGDIAAIRAIAEDERRAVVDARERLETAGLTVPIVSVGSTPTATHAAALAGVTELRAGVYVFMDAFQAAIGSCTLDDVATTVLATVIGHQRAHGRALIDAGGLALSKDRSTRSLGGARDCGYGLVLDEGGSTLLEDLIVAEVYQEHGVLESRPGASLDFARLPLGSRVRIVPNHSCMTCSAFDAYQVVDGDRCVAVWPRIHEWSRT
jgi:D-serine deaminase-like pyridoxal phosphate-dependent protein